ncbi:hypothetical protein PHLGIDRAFT_52988, partial [Phlebiopsis gigantea 11061_1 CR5-6]
TSTPMVLTSKDNEIFAALPGRPVNDPTWDATTKGVVAAMQHAEMRLRFSKKRDRRGPFKTIASGVSYGGGQKRPGNLKLSKHNQKIMDKLYNDPHMKRLIRWGNAMIASYFPLIYREYVANMTKLHQQQPYLRHIRPDTVFPAASANFGGVVCQEHADFGNKANGICPIWCGGSFDYRKGGHLVLRQLKLVIQFPPGSLICIPSATLRHGNTPIAKGETRVSFTQYAAGGLFRWVQYGFQ